MLLSLKLVELSGDIESLPYIESVRQLVWDMGEKNAIVIHLTLVPYLAAAGGENKTNSTFC
jgi:CTP synthase